MVEGRAGKQGEQPLPQQSLPAPHQRQRVVHKLGEESGVVACLTCLTLLTEQTRRMLRLRSNSTVLLNWNTVWWSEKSSVGEAAAAACTTARLGMELRSGQGSGKNCKLNGSFVLHKIMFECMFESLQLANLTEFRIFCHLPPRCGNRGAMQDEGGPPHGESSNWVV